MDLSNNTVLVTGGGSGIGLAIAKRFLDAGRLYLIQAKRYRGYINPKHVHDFNQVIQREKAYGGFFIHSGKTGIISKGTAAGVSDKFT